MALLLALVFESAALAGPSPAEAEVLRLTEEIARLSQKTAWPGVERKYEALLEIKKVRISAETHLHAAHAAQARGDIATANIRANRALTAAESDPASVQKASEWLADFLVNYGEASLELSVAFKGEPTIESRDPVFSPKVRTILAFASSELSANRVFQGYLPIGRYKVGDEVFDIDGGPARKVFVKPVKGGTDEAVPEPTPEPRGERTVVLAVRGGGWSAVTWGSLSTQVRDALYSADGVLSVDVLAPNDPWIVATPDVEKMSERGLTMVGVAEQVKQALPEAQVVYTTTQLAVAPGFAPPTLASVAVLEEGEVVVKLEDVASIAPSTPDLPVPADTGAVPRYSIQVRTKGSVDELLLAAGRVEGAESLGLKPEEPPSR
ncbi:MAG: hypothetical protein R3F61_18560 [Myxococcota bacterium]